MLRQILTALTLFVGASLFGQVRVDGPFAGSYGNVGPQISIGIQNPSGDARAMPGLAAWYDVSDENSLIYDSSNRVSLVADKSGNSNENCLVLNGASGNYASVPDSAALDVTGDIDLRCFCACTDWTNGSQTFLNKRESDSTISFTFIIDGAGNLSARFSSNGNSNAGESAASSASVPFSDQQSGWVRVTRVASTGVVRFWTSNDGITWTQLGTDQSTNVYNIFASTSRLELGSRAVGTADLLSGRIYRAQIYNGIDGTLVFDADFTAQPKLATSFAESANGATVTINSSGSTGARICGARDLYQGTVASQPIFVTKNNGQCYTPPGVSIDTTDVDQDSIYFDGATANRRAEWTPGDAGDVAGSPLTMLFEFDVPASQPSQSAYCGFASGSAFPDANGIAYLLAGSGDEFWVRQGDGTNYRRMIHSTFRTAYAGQRVKGAVVFDSGNSTTDPKIYVNGVDISSSFATTTGGTAPNWLPTTLTTAKFLCFQWCAGYFVPLPPINAALTAAEVLSHYTTGRLPSWCEVGTGSMVATFTSDFSAGTGGVTVGTGSSTLTGNIDGIDGRNDNLRVSNSSGSNQLLVFSIASLESLIVNGWRYRMAVSVFPETGSLSSATARFGYGGSINANTVDAAVLNENAWNDIYVEFVSARGPGANHMSFGIFGGASGATVAAILNGKNVYFRNIVITPLGPIFKPVIGPTKIHDESTNNIEGTFSSGAYPVIFNPDNSLWFDGSDDFLKAAPFSLSQPETVYFVGQQVSWTGTDSIFDGNSGTERMQLAPRGTTPEVALWAGSSDAPSNSAFDLRAAAAVTSVFNGASSGLRVNRGASATGNPGSHNGNGFTLGSTNAGSNNGNITAHEIAIYSRALSDSEQLSFINSRIAKWRIIP